MRSGPTDAFWEAREVLDLRGRGELSTKLRSGQNERCQVGTGGVNGSGPTGASGPDNNEVFHRGATMWVDRCESMGRDVAGDLNGRDH